MIAVEAVYLNMELLKYKTLGFSSPSTIQIWKLRVKESEAFTHLANFLVLGTQLVMLCTKK